MQPTNFIISTSYDGRSRKLFPVVCTICGKTAYRPKHLLRKALFCSAACSAVGHQNRVTYSCAQCHSPIVRAAAKIKGSRSGLVFCNRTCKDTAQSYGGIEAIQPDHYNQGQSSYRVRALRHYGARCKVCDYSQDSRMLDVHHIDEDRSHNDLPNLVVLCVWCHALETRKSWPSDP